MSDVVDERFPQTLLAARTGAEWAWASIYRDLAPSVLGYLRARGVPDAENVTGDVFLQVVRDLPRFEGGEQEFRAWVFTIAHYRLIDARRWHARRPVELTPEPTVAETGSGDTEDEALHQIAVQRVCVLLQQLPPDQRAVLLLRVLGQLTIEEVARVLGKSPGSVKALQRRGLKAVQRALEREGVPL